MKVFAVRCTYSASRMFSGDKEPITRVSLSLVEAESADEAASHAMSRSSVLAIKAGLTIEVGSVDWGKGATWHATYDGEPLTEAHTATDAKLVMRRT